jgi:parvulin-like peptidyl-prolyl isomerase
MMNFVKTKRVAVLLLSASLLASVAYAGQSDPVVAKYKGGDVRESQVMLQFRSLLDAYPNTKGKSLSELDANTQEDIIQRCVIAQILEKEAKKSNIESSKEFREKLKLAKGQMLIQDFLLQQVKARVTQQEIDARYNALVDELQGQEQVRAWHITVGSKKEADSVQSMLKTKKFAEVAVEYPKKHPNAKSGEIGYVRQGELNPVIEAQLFKLKPNEVSAPFKDGEAWHIMTITDRGPASIPSKEEATAGITQQLQKESFERYINKLKIDAGIQVLLAKRDAAN